jgi:hypothetical protein
VRLGIFLGIASGLRVDDEIDVRLPVQGDVLALVLGNRGKAHLGEQVAKHLRVGGGIFDEFETVGAHRVGKTRNTLFLD